MDELETAMVKTPVHTLEGLGAVSTIAARHFRHEPGELSSDWPARLIDAVLEQSGVEAVYGVTSLTGDDDHETELRRRPSSAHSHLQTN